MHPAARGNDHAHGMAPNVCVRIGYMSTEFYICSALVVSLDQVKKRNHIHVNENVRLFRDQKSPVWHRKAKSSQID